MNHRKPKRPSILFVNKIVYLKEDPKKGICSKCGKKGYTQMHHLRYHKDNPLKDTIELCVSCHGKTERGLDSIDIDKLLLRFQCATCKKSLDIKQMVESSREEPICKSCYSGKYRRYKIKKGKIGRPVKNTEIDSFQKHDTGKRKGLFL